MAYPEILAPVGGQEQLLAAVRCGAEAVYLGTARFNARRNAANFDGDALAQAVRYCHGRGVRVYVTVNTLATDRELPALEQTADEIAAAGADGVILQDMAALGLFAGRYPSLHRVASTQTAVHNIDGARFLQDAGFDSFVLARELTLEEMAAICAAVDIPAEAFVHGAHCVSLSGTCCLSAMLGGRSGNRGLCAQPCRLDWRCGARHYALSLKDMSLVDHIQALNEAGVRTLKIEGRMKRPEYVAAAVTACRNARAGLPYDRETLRAVFSRNGFTDSYLTGHRGREMFGFRGHEDVTAASPEILRNLQELYRMEKPLVPVDMAFSMTATGPSLTVSDGTRSVTADGPAPQPSVNRATDASAAETHLRKTGGTQYYVNNLTVSVAPGLNLPVSALNSLRRQALAELDERRSRGTPIERQSWTPPVLQPRERSGVSPLWARFFRAGQITAEDELDKLILPVSEVTPALLARYGPRLAAQLPTLLFPAQESALEERLAALKEAGLEEVWTDNIYGLALGRRLGLRVLGGFGLNITNAWAVDFYEKRGLAALTASFELSMSAVRALGSTVPLGIATYGRLPLMRFRACPVRAGIGCAACGGQGKLTDRKGIVFPVECDGRQYSTLLNSVPLNIAGRDDPGDFRLLYFTTETAAECGAVIGGFVQKRRPDGPHTGGLYYRTLL